MIETAKAVVPSQVEIAKAVGKTSRQIENYLQAFKALFVLYEVVPYKTSVGKPLFYIFDAGIAGSLDSDLSRRFQVWFLNECLSQHSYAGEPYPDIFYYESSKGSRIDFIVQSKRSQYAIQLSDEEAPKRYSMRAPEAFCKKHPDLKVIVAAPCLASHSLEKNLAIVPWTALVG